MKVEPGGNIDYTEENLLFSALFGLFTGILFSGLATIYALFKINFFSALLVGFISFVVVCGGITITSFLVMTWWQSRKVRKK